MSRRHQGPADGGEVTEQLPPHSPECEQGVLACIMLAPGEVMPLVRDELAGQVAAFYDLRHQVIFGAMLELVETGDPIDLVTLTTRLKESGKLDDGGGLPYIAALPDAVPSAANVRFYLDTVKARWTDRQMVQVLVEEGTRIGVTDEDVSERHARIAQRVTKVAAGAEVGKYYQPVELIRAVTAKWDAAAEHRGHDGLARFAISTGIGFLDIRTTGLHPGELIILAGRPGDGKTALATTMMLDQTIRQKRSVGFLSIEMKAEEMMGRMICNEAEVDFMKVRSGYASGPMLYHLGKAGFAMMNAKLVIHDDTQVSPARMEAIAARMVAQHGIEIFYIDHLNEIVDPANKGDEGADVKAAVTAARNIARAHNIPVVALQQLNRESVKGKGRGMRPAKHDLRGHGASEQVANGIWMLYRDSKLEEEEASNGWTGTEGVGPEAKQIERLMTIIVAKNRNGPEGDVLARFLLPQMRYKDFTTHGSRQDWKTKQAAERAAQPPAEPQSGEWLNEIGGKND